MKHNLNYFSSYLPYKLQLIVPDTTMICTLAGVNYSDQNIEVDYPRKKNGCKGEILNFYDGENRGHNGYIDNCKLLLRPGSDITKEIEVNGKRFVPIDVFFEMEYSFKPNEEFGYRGIGKFASGSVYMFHHTRHNPMSFISCDLLEMDYKFVQKLFEWHFDLFGLIPVDLAIDINKIQKWKTKSH